jgi:hypothetical protein
MAPRPPGPKVSRNKLTLPRAMAPEGLGRTRELARHLSCKHARRAKTGGKSIPGEPMQIHAKCGRHERRKPLRKQPGHDAGKNIARATRAEHRATRRVHHDPAFGGGDDGGSPLQHDHRTAFASKRAGRPDTVAIHLGRREIH